MSSPPWDYIAKLVCIGDSGCGKSSLTIRLCEGRFVAHHDVTIGVEFGSRIVPVGPPHSSSRPLPSISSSTSPSSPSVTTTPQQPDQDQQQQSQSSPPQPPSEDASSQPKSKPNGLPTPRLLKGDQNQPQKHMKLSLWDTAGQETYKSVTRSYFRGASGALLVFDLTRRATFAHATDWLADLRQIAEPDIVVVLVGNKADLASPHAGDGDGDDGDGTAANPGGGGEGESRGNRREVTRREAEDWARRNGVLEYVETSAKSGAGVEDAFMRVAERIYQNIQAGRYDLNDRRSGVKGPGAAGVGGAAAGGGGRQVRLAGGGGEAGKGVAGGCC